MANVYSMPPDTNEREKIVGGLLTLGQAAWIAVGGVLYVIWILVTYRVLGAFSFILGIGFLVFGFYFGLKKVDDLPYPKYLRLKRIYKKKVKNYINKGEKTELSFSIEEGE